MKPLLISGVTGVGTTSIASAIANRRGIQYLIGTDAIREATRQIIRPEVSPSLHQSSYLAGKSKNYSSKSEEIKREKIIRGFKNQSSAVKICIDGIIIRYQIEGLRFIIEGINLLPGDYDNLIKRKEIRQILIDIPQETIHLDRIRLRTSRNPSRGNQYKENFKEIRWLRDYLLRRARDNNIVIVENDGKLEDTVMQSLSIIDE